MHISKAHKTLTPEVMAVGVYLFSLSVYDKFKYNFKYKMTGESRLFGCFAQACHTLLQKDTPFTSSQNKCVD